MTTTDSGQVLDCGHLPTVTEGVGTGFATDARFGKTMCYACADEQIRTDFKTAAYGETLTTYWEGRDPSRPNRVTIITWSGGVIGAGYRSAWAVGNFGATRAYVTVKIEGRLWHGMIFRDAHQLVRLRLYKKQDHA